LLSLQAVKRTEEESDLERIQDLFPNDTLCLYEKDAITMVSKIHKSTVPHVLYAQWVQKHLEIFNTDVSFCAARLCSLVLSEVDA
jgi:hypothetical protein